MRLGQLARKYQVSLQEIISYLKEMEPTTYETLHHNSKLNEYTKTLLAKRFEFLEKLNEETPEEIEEKLVEPKVADMEDTKVPLSELDVPLPEAEVQDLQKKVEVAIESDKLLELLESEKSSIDLSKITLIKAPKKELSGLKVVGKIELPEPKNKTVEKSEQLEKEPKPGRHQRRQLNEEELDKRRLKAKKMEKEYQARQEKLRKKQKKALNKAHYQQKLQRTKNNQLKHKDKTPRPQSSSEVKEQGPNPKTILGKFWRWMNT